MLNKENEYADEPMYVLVAKLLNIKINIYYAQDLDKPSKSYVPSDQENNFIGQCDLLFSGPESGGHFDYIDNKRVN